MLDPTFFNSVLNILFWVFGITVTAILMVIGLVCLGIWLVSNICDLYSTLISHEEWLAACRDSGKKEIDQIQMWYLAHRIMDFKSLAIELGCRGDNLAKFVPEEQSNYRQAWEAGTKRLQQLLDAGNSGSIYHRIFEKVYSNNDLEAKSADFAFINQLYSKLLEEKSPTLAALEAAAEGSSFEQPELLGEHTAAFDPTMYMNKQQGMEFLKEHGIDYTKELEKLEKSLSEEPAVEKNKPWGFCWVPIAEHPLDNRLTIAWNGQSIQATRWLPDEHAFENSSGPDGQRFTHYLTYIMPLSSTPEIV